MSGMRKPTRQNKTRFIGTEYIGFIASNLSDNVFICVMIRVPETIGRTV
jgi:hypothetical protein